MDSDSDLSNTGAILIMAFANLLLSLIHTGKFTEVFTPNAWKGPAWKDKQK